MCENSSNWPQNVEMITFDTSQFIVQFWVKFCTLDGYSRSFHRTLGGFLGKTVQQIDKNSRPNFEISFCKSCEAVSCVKILKTSNTE